MVHGEMERIGVGGDIEEVDIEDIETLDEMIPDDVDGMDEDE